MLSGKFIGFILGLIFGGPLAAFIGLFLGHLYDSQTRRSFWRRAHQTGHSEKQAIFFETTFSVMGHIAKSDGRISKEEIRAAERVMNHLGLNQEQRKEAIEFFNQGKQSNFDLKETLFKFRQITFHEQALVQLFINIQMNAAAAESGLTPQKQNLLNQICGELGLAIFDLHLFEQIFRHASSQREQQHYQPRQASNSLESAYRELNIKQDATDAEVKKAYRKQMSQNHPDKLISKGLPPEMIKVANEKTQQIKEAYEAICRARGIK